MSTATLFHFGDVASIQNPNFAAGLESPAPGLSFDRWANGVDASYWSGYTLAQAGRSCVIPTDLGGIHADAFAEGWGDGLAELDPEKTAEWLREVESMAEEQEALDLMQSGWGMW